SLASGFLFGAVPVRQTLRTDPYEVVKAGPTAAIARGFAVRDLLLILQIAVCAVLVTSSLVAVRGLVRSMHSRFGFDPNNAMLIETDLTMAGYKDDAAAAMQKRMVDAFAAIQGAQAVGSIDQPPLWAGWNIMSVFTDTTTDLRPANAAAQAITYRISPRYFEAAGTAMLAGRAGTLHDGKNAPPVAVVNQEFARRIFGSAIAALGRSYKVREGAPIQIVGVVEDGKYTGFAESPKLAMFFPMLQSPSNSTWIVMRSNRSSQELA